jgi:hypothetical protein
MNRLAGLAIALAVLATPALARGGSNPVPTQGQLAACPDFSRFNWRKLEREGALHLKADANAIARSADAHKRIRGPYALPDVARADVTLSVAVGAGETQSSPVHTSSFVWRDDRGRWFIDRVDYGPAWTPAPLPPDATPPQGDQWIEYEQREAFRGPLNPDQVQRLEAALADPCLQIQPDAPPLQIPVKGRPDAPCLPGTGAALTIRSAAGTRLIVDRCGRWAAGELMNAVMYGTPDPTHVVAEALRARRGADFIADEILLRRGNSPFPYVQVLCGSINPRARPMPKHLIYTRDTSRDAKPRTELLLEESDPNFHAQWVRLGCNLPNPVDPTSAGSGR